ncbi:acetylornithine deacetylase/succinyl-diaminopimelate desuccinylase-like protein [Bradyrhizobium sp. JR6.1]
MRARKRGACARKLKGSPSCQSACRLSEFIPNQVVEFWESTMSHRPRNMVRSLQIAAAFAPLLLASGASAQGLTEQQQFARGIYQELVEINTTTATGDTQKAAEAMGARLRAAGFPEGDVHVFSPAPHKGNLVARLHGSGARKPILLVAHIDVVPALREDWSVDPFKLTEQDGYFYGRGSSDDKYMASAFITNLIRYKKESYKPDRDIIVALETDEEILDANGLGMQWLIKNHRDLIDAEFALNEGGGVGLKNGKAIRNSVQTSEKVSIGYQLTVKDRGGHSSLPRKDNAIYRLAEGLVRLSNYDFPMNLNETTRIYFTKDRRGRQVACRRYQGNPGTAARSGGAGAIVGESWLQRAAPHHLRRDHAGRRPRHQCAAAAGDRQGELPDSARRAGRRRSGDDRARARRQATRSDPDRKSRVEPAVAFERRDHGIGREAVEGVLAECRNRPGDEHRRHRRQLSAQCRNSDLWSLRARRRCRRQPEPWQG